MLLSLFTLGSKIDQVLTRKPAPKARPSHLGKTVKAYGPNLETFTLQYAVVELDSLISSDKDNFPSKFQPRDRSRVSSNLQVNSIAKNLNPLGLLEEFKSLDRGAPIISDSLVVLSGNGRIMALRQSQKYGLYAAQLALIAPRFGITQKTSYLKKPVLVRVLRDNTNLVDFCKIANGAGIMAQAITETAMSDIDIKVNTGALDYNFVVGQFLAGLPQNDRAALVDSRGELNKAGKARFESALFYQVYGSKKLLELSQETIDPDCKNLIGAMVEMLLPLAQLEQSIKNGEKFDTCSFAGEFSLVANKFVGLKADGIKIKTYLDQPALFEELAGNQKLLLAEIDGAKSKKQIVGIIQAWIDLASETPHPSQVGMFGEVEAPQLWDRFFNKLA